MIARLLVALASLLGLQRHTTIVLLERRHRRARQRARYLELIGRGIAPAAAARSIGLPVFSGGDGTDAELFPDLEDIAALTDEQLAAVEAKLVELFNKVKDVDESDERIANLTTDEVIKALERGAAQIKAVRERRVELETAAEEARARIDAIAAEVEGAGAEGAEGGDAGDGGDPPPADPPPDDDEGDGETSSAEAANEPVTAAGRTPARSLRPRRAARNAPDGDPADDRGSLVLLTDVPSVGSAGSEVTSMEQVAQAFRYRMDRLRSVRGGKGGERFPVVSLRLPRAEHHIGERAGASEANSILASAIRAQVRGRNGEDLGPAPLLAHGGICIPQQTNTNLPAPVYSQARPVRDMLPRVGVDRGGISFIRPPLLSDVPALAVGDVTSTEDVSATPADYTKTYARVTCPTASEVLVDAVFWQLEFGVQDSRTWPELVDYWVNLTVTAHAAHAEHRLLDALKAGSTLVTVTVPNNDVTDGATTPNIVLGFAANLIRQLRTLTAGIRSRNRMDALAPMRVSVPSWVPDLYAIDNAMRQPDNPDQGTRARFEAVMRSHGFEMSYYLDSPTTPAVKFGAQGAGALTTFPATFLAFTFVDGTWVYLDGGELDLGVVRDADLVNTNDYRVFYESFENIARVGNESYALTLSTCANGATSAAIPIGTC